MTQTQTQAQTRTMAAIRVHAWGGPEALRYEWVARPEPGPGEVLIRVHAAGVNPPDWYARSGFSIIPPELRPPTTFPFIPGSDVSGVVVGLGQGVGEWAEGDEVFGLLRFPTTPGAAKGYAEFTTAPVGDLARVPGGVDHVHAAAVPMAGLTAHQYVVDLARVGAGSRVLVNGAAGGVGHFAVQLAKAAGAHVIAVASTRHQGFLRDLGADEFVDYTAGDVVDVVGEVDQLIDTVGGLHAYRLVPALRRGGVLCPVFFGDYHEAELAEREIVLRAGQVRSDGRRLDELARSVGAGALRVGIDGVFPLAEARSAHARAERGHLQGKLVLDVVGAG